MSLGGEMPAGPNMAALTSMNLAAGGNNAGAQMWLCSWLPMLDFKPGITPIAEIVPFFTKQMMPGAQACKFLPVMPQGFLAKIFGEIFQGFQLEDWASGLSQEQIEAIMQARASGISDPDSGMSVSMQALGAMRNVAMNQASMIDSGGGPSVG